MSQPISLPVDEIARLIARGHPIVVHDGHALDLTNWIDNHPGGRLAILHMVGRDATDEINVYHSPKALLMMKAHRLGRIQEPWANLDPPIRSPDYYDNLALKKEAEVSVPANSRRSRRSVDLSSVRLLRHYRYQDNPLRCPPMLTLDSRLLPSWIKS